jgi:hypothetical protein
MTMRRQEPIDLCEEIWKWTEESLSHSDDVLGAGWDEGSEISPSYSNRRDKLSLLTTVTATISWVNGKGGICVHIDVEGLRRVAVESDAESWSAVQVLEDSHELAVVVLVKLLEQRKLTGKRMSGRT